MSPFIDNLDQFDAMALRSENARLREEVARLFDEMELAWGIIANAGGNGDWSKESKEWQGAAQRWRDRYFALTAARQR
jgi:hypothetical protein